MGRSLLISLADRQKRLLLGLLAVLGLSACSIAVRAIGRVNPASEGMVITATNGKVRALTLTGGALPIRYLDGHLVELDGRWRRGAIDVEGWRVVEGLNGLPAWVGVVRQHPQGLALHLPDVDLWYELLVESDSEIHTWTGRPLLVEGFIEGTGLRVMYYRPLFDEHAR